LASRSRRVVADSDVLIQYLRRDAEVRAAFERCRAQDIPIALTPVSVAEVVSGIRPGEEARTRVLLDSYECLRINREVGDAAGEFLARYTLSHGLRMGDALIAACAVVHRHRLWTRNRRHYPMREVQFFSP
jgi:hypothetical protein